MTETALEVNSQDFSPLTVAAYRRLKWLKQARPNQTPPENKDWSTWVALAGRGWGKTRTAAEWIAWQASANDNTRWAIVAPTFSDARDTCAEGPSGIVTVLREMEILKDYNRSMGEIILHNKSRIKLFSAEEPDRLRGPNFHGGWFDELAAQNPDAWDQYKFALRLGEHPQTVITTTPRPTKIIKALLDRDDTIVVRGSTFDNQANLSPSALAELRLRYEGTRLGRQELYGEVIDDVEGALWSRDIIEAGRVGEAPPLVRVVVGVDPAVTSGENSDSTGIIVAGVSSDGHYYVLEDCTMKGSPDQWARVAVDAYHRHKADRIIGETNNGGDMIELLMRQVDPSVSFKKIVSTRGKLLRAEPIASLYEQQRAHHVGGFPELEDQMTSYTIDTRSSPDRLDAAVFALTELTDSVSSMMGLAALAKFCPSCRMPAPRTATVCPSCHTPLGE
jgi:phage terminase large subunit-like protein